MSLVSNNNPTGPYEVEDDASFDEVAASWKEKWEAADTDDALKTADEVIGERDSSETPAEAAPPAPEEALEEPKVEENVTDLLQRAREEAARREQERQAAIKAGEAEKLRGESQGFRERLKSDPLAVLDELGLDLIDLANSAYARELGDKAPEEFRKKMADSAIERKVEAKLKELDNRQQELLQTLERQRQAEVIDRLDMELQEAVKSVPAQHQHLARVASKDAETAYQALVDGVVEFQKYTGRLPTAQQALQIAEAGFAKMAAALLPPAEVKESPKPQAPEGSTRKPATKTLAGQDSAERPNRRREIEDPDDSDYWAQRAVKVFESKRRSG